MLINFLRLNRDIESRVILSELIYAELDSSLTQLQASEHPDLDLWHSTCSLFAFYFGNSLISSNQSSGEHSLLWQGMVDLDSMIAASDNASDYNRLHEFIYPGQSIFSIGEYAYNRRHFASDGSSDLAEAMLHLASATEIIEEHIADD